MRKSTISLALVLVLLVTACGGESSDTTQASSDTTQASAPASTTGPDSTVAAVSPLAGEWERAETSSFSSLAGMIVEVDEEGTTAVIVSVPENEFQFTAGDEKWTTITPGAENEWTFQDLQRESGSGAESHVEGIITMSEDGGTLTMTFPTTGTTQEWVRIGD